MSLIPRTARIGTPVSAFFALVRELANEQRERFGVTGDPQGASVHRIETHIADERGSNLFAA